MRWAAAATCFALSLSTTAVARGQPTGDVGRAETLFNAAKALLDAGQYVDACTKFLESKRLAPGLGVTLYLADCYERIGRTASAWAEFRSAEGLARERNDKRVDLARARAQALEGKLDRLTVSVAPTVPQAGLQVLRDGVLVPPEEWGVPVPVDPGDHAVVVSSPGHPTRTLAAHVDADKSTATVTIDRLDEPAPAPNPTAPPAPAAPAVEAPAPAQPTTPPPPTQTDPGSTRRWIGIGVGAAGVVGVGVGAALGLVAKSKLDQSNNGPCDATDHCTSDGLSLRRSAQGAATGSTIAFVAGGAVLAAGVVIFVTAPHAPSATAILVQPQWFAGGGGAVLRTSFF